MCVCGSFQGLLQEGVPLLTGSQLGDDLQSVVEGVNSILAARGMGVLDFNGERKEGLTLVCRETVINYNA